MSSASRKEDQRLLERKLLRADYRKLLLNLQERAPLLRSFETWGDALAFMRHGTSRDPRKDEVLRPIFQALAKDKDHRCQKVLLAIFWPALESIFCKKNHWDDDPEELWANVQWVFLQVIFRIDVTKRPNGLVQKVYNDTIHLLYDECRSKWDREDRELATNPRELDELAGGQEDMGFAAVEFRDEQEAEIRRLKAHMEAGRLSEPDFLLIVGTRIYGDSLTEAATQAKLGYQAAKKRRQRAEAAIRRFEEEQRK